MAEKMYSTLAERMALLRKQGMTIDEQNQEQMRVLETYSYYNVFSGYRQPFMQDGFPEVKQYVPGTTPTDVQAFYDFDKGLRMHLLQYVLDIEEMFKHYVTQAFYEYHIRDNRQLSAQEKGQLHRERFYLRHHLYDNGTADKEKQIHRAISGIAEAIEKQYRREHGLIRHYRDDYGYIPLWIAMNVLTFGSASRYFDIQLPPIQRETMDDLGFPHWQQAFERTAEFQRCLQILTATRNICAHGERLFVVVHDEQLDPRFYRLSAEASQQLQRHQGGLFASLFVTHLFTPPHLRAEFITGVEQLLAKLDANVRAVSPQVLRRHLGLDFNWQESLSTQVVRKGRKKW